VIIFSPDDLGSQECCEAFIRGWASHGYAIVQLTRAAALSRDRNALSSAQNVRSKAVRDRASSAPSGIRALDVTSIIDLLPALQARFPEIRGKLDSAHIGVAGQGAGAVSAAAIAGALLELPGGPHSNLADPRVRGIICIASQARGHSGLTEHSFDQLFLPYLGIAGNQDTRRAKFTSAGWQRAAFERSQPGDKYELSVQNAAEGVQREQSIAPDDSSKGEWQSDATARYVNAVTLAFWDAYLKHNRTAKGYLQSDALKKTGYGALTLEQR
jgi:predicted dienelactone hydrolase